MADRTMTAPQAIIKQNGNPIGLVRNIRLSETMARGSVRGLGTLYESERPALTFNGTWNCDQYLIDLEKSGITGVDNRKVGDYTIYENNKILLETPVDIVISRKEAEAFDENGNVIGTGEEDFAVITDVYLDSMSFDISEGAISGFNQSGVYTKPVILPI